MNPAPYTSGNVFDAVMFYQAYRPARQLFANVAEPFDASQFVQAIEAEWNRLPEPARYAMMNVNATHDALRLLTDFYNPARHK